jgi:quercetin dioxygenase-like cupin family protein
VGRRGLSAPPASLTAKESPMAIEEKVRSIGDLPVQHARAPNTQAAERARFFNSGNAFNIKLPEVPNAVFVAEPQRALAPETPTGFIACDASAEMHCPFPATTPLILARYGRIRAGETLEANFNATGVIHYVIEGRGTTALDGETIEWAPGDIFIAPGGQVARHKAGSEDAVLWVVSNEPLLAFENLRAPDAASGRPTDLVHYTADEIRRQIDLLYEIDQDENVAGMALVMSSDKQQAGRNVLPSLTLAMNTLAPGAVQRAHRHNSVAVSLVIQGHKCFSTIDGERKDWAPWATTITPPTSVHSHHNDGSERALFLIVQDGGLYYHARAMGFAFVD